MDLAVVTLRARNAALLVLAIGVGLLSLALSLAMRGSAAPGAPRIISAPEGGDESSEFAFSGAGPFECALDAVRFVPCTSPAAYGFLPAGRHLFLVRGISRSGERGDVASVHWVVRPRLPGEQLASIPRRASGGGQVVAGDGLDFGIGGDLPRHLSPGHGGAIPLRIQNPYPYAIVVTGLRVTVGPGSTRAGCDGRVELGLRQSNTLQAAVAVLVAPHSSVTLPAQGASAPFLWMRNRSVNQDACKGASFTLRYSGVAGKEPGA